METAREVQRRYWQPNPTERRGLESRGLPVLTWKQKLRLLHLVVLDALATPEGALQLNSQGMAAQDAPPSPDRDLISRLVADLSANGGACSPRYAVIWQGKPGETDTRPPDIRGNLRNASLTHVGCLEILRVDGQQHPTEVDFVPLDDLQGAAFAGGGTFRWAKLFYEGTRAPEVVLAPLIYGVSWNGRNAHDCDGSLTRFIWHLDSPTGGMKWSVGVGHQDLIVEGKEQVLFGLGSVGDLMVALSVGDPRFVEKCRGRGLDPAEARKSLEAPAGR